MCHKLNIVNYDINPDNDGCDHVDDEIVSSFTDNSSHEMVEGKGCSPEKKNGISVVGKNVIKVVIMEMSSVCKVKMDTTKIDHSIDSESNRGKDAGQGDGNICPF